MNWCRSVNVGSTPLTRLPVTMIDILPKPLPVLIIGIVTHPHIAKELSIRLDPLSGLHRHHAAVIHCLDYTKVDLVVMVVIRYHDRVIISMLIRISDPNRLTHKLYNVCSVRRFICRQTAQRISGAVSEGGLNPAYHKSDTSTFQQTPITAHPSNIVVPIMLNVGIILFSFSMLYNNTVP
jgi:hypothetical protein